MLDEAITATDAETEQLITRTMAKLSEHVTKTIIADRLSTTRNGGSSGVPQSA